MLPSVVPRFTTDSAVRVFPGVWKLLSFLRLPSQVRAAQVMRCLVSAVTLTYHLPHPCHSVFWVYNQHTFSGGC